MKEKAEQENRFLDMLESYKSIIAKVSGCHDSEEQKDLIQEIIIQLWKAFPKYNKKFSIATWIYRISINVSISFLRRKTSHQKTYENYKSEIKWIDFNHSDKDERLDTLYRSIDLLKPIDKAIIMLYLDGHPNKEIAQITGLTASNISTRKLRITETLRDFFKTKKMK